MRRSALDCSSRSPGFSIVAVLTLALSIGGNTAIFSVVNALALKPLPARNAEEIVRIYTAESLTSWPNYQDIAARSEVFSDVAAHTGADPCACDGRQHQPDLRRNDLGQLSRDVRRPRAARPRLSAL